MVRRLAFPAPPPAMVWSGRGGGGRGAGVCGEWSGRLGGVLLWAAMGHWVTERAGIIRKPYASHKPYNVGRVPVLINLNLYFILETLHPSLNPA